MEWLTSVCYQVEFRLSVGGLHQSVFAKAEDAGRHTFSRPTGIRIMSGEVDYLKMVAEVTGLCACSD